VRFPEYDEGDERKPVLRVSDDREVYSGLRLEIDNRDGESVYVELTFRETERLAKHLLAGIWGFRR